MLSVFYCRTDEIVQQRPLIFFYQQVSLEMADSLKPKIMSFLVALLSGSEILVRIMLGRGDVDVSFKWRCQVISLKKKYVD